MRGEFWSRFGRGGVTGVPDRFMETAGAGELSYFCDSEYQNGSRLSGSQLFIFFIF
jgi:hypothetical protein